MQNSDRARITPGIVLLVLVGSASISAWSVFADPIINIDGVLYIKAAEALSRGDIQAALSLYKWPFYPFLIYFTNKITGLELTISAHFLNAVFNFLSCGVFVLLCSELGGGRRTILIAALTIVLFPGLNEIRSYIIRDHGYILFYLSSLYFLLSALRTRSSLLLSASFICMGMATLFRIEGFVFLVVIPLVYFYSVGDTKPVNRERWMVIAAIAAMLLIPVFGWWFYNPEEGSGYAKFSLESIRSGWDQAHQVLETKIDTLKNKIINTASSSVGRLVFLWTVIGIILVQVLIILSIPYAILAGYAFKKDLIFPNAIAVKPWKLFVYCNVGILVLFTLTWLFLTDRYPLALVVTLLMTVPFALEQVYENWRSRADRAIMFKAGYILLGLILVFNVVEGFTSYSDKRYLKESGIWLRDNVHQSTRLYTNDHIIGFYSGLPEINTSVVQNRDKMLALFYRGKWIKYDYLALQVDPDPELERHLKKTLWVVPEQVFRGNRNREVRVYNIKKYRERKNQ